MWRSDSSEWWNIGLKPAYSRGDWCGIKALHGFEARDLPKAPTAFITRLDVPIRAFGTMWRSAAPALAQQLPHVPGLRMGIAMIDRVYVHAMTFSVWRSANDALTFAYARDSHQQAVDRLRVMAPSTMVPSVPATPGDPLRSPAPAA